MAELILIGNLTDAPEVRWTPNGRAVASFTIAENHGHKDKQSGEWIQDGATFWRCETWDCAEAVAELTKGQRVIATGFSKTRAFETREGEKRTVLEVTVTDIGPSLRQKRQAGGNGQGAGWAQQSAPSYGQQAGGFQQPQQANGRDPWAQANDDSTPPF